MILIHLIVVLAAVIIGVRVGGIGIGFAGGFGVLLLGLLGAIPGELPLTVVAFIMVVIVAVAAMQEAGGMDYLVHLADRILRKNPRYLSILGPVVIYLLTFASSTGQASFAVMPVIVEVGKENNIRPKRALTVGVAASLVAITASPISASVLIVSDLLEEGETGWDFLTLLAVTIPATFVAVIVTSIVFMTWDKIRGETTLTTLPSYDEKLHADQLLHSRKAAERELPPYARRSVMIFLAGLVVVLTYSVLTSQRLGLVNPDSLMSGADARMATMLTVALAISVFCKVDITKIPAVSTFKVGMTASVCILGMAWLGTTFMVNHEVWIEDTIGETLVAVPWLLAVVMLIGSSLLYSQAATAKVFIPTALAIGVAPEAAVAAFPASSGMFVLPNYPTLVASVQLDDTQSTTLGKHIFDHPFLLPGLCVTGLSVAISFLMAGIF